MEISFKFTFLSGANVIIGLLNDLEHFQQKVEISFKLIFYQGPMLFVAALSVQSQYRTSQHEANQIWLFVLHMPGDAPNSNLDSFFGIHTQGRAYWYQFFSVESCFRSRFRNIIIFYNF
jgi:hypothetical protein